MRIAFFPRRKHSEITLHKIASRLSSESKTLNPIEIADDFLGSTGSH